MARTGPNFGQLGRTRHTVSVLTEQIACRSGFSGLGLLVLAFVQPSLHLSHGLSSLSVDHLFYVENRLGSTLNDVAASRHINPCPLADELKMLRVA